MENTTNSMDANTFLHDSEGHNIIFQEKKTHRRANELKNIRIFFTVFRTFSPDYCYS